MTDTPGPMEAVALLHDVFHNTPGAQAELVAEARRQDEIQAALAGVLKAYERWEADVIMDNRTWRILDDLPHLTQEQWDELVAIQGQRNAALALT